MTASLLFDKGQLGRTGPRPAKGPCRQIKLQWLSRFLDSYLSAEIIDSSHYSIVKDNSADLGVNFKIVQNRPTVKFIYSEKATKFCNIFPLLLSTVHKDISKGKISQNFVAFSEYMNFNT